jgi:hypothetical protein
MCPPSSCTRDSTCLNIFVETVRRVATLIFATYVIQQHRETASDMVVCFIQLHSKIMFNNKHTLHCLKRIDACYTNNWLKYNEHEETASNHRLGGVTGVQCCRWTRQTEMSLSDYENIYLLLGHTILRCWNPTQYISITALLLSQLIHLWKLRSSTC